MKIVPRNFIESQKKALKRGVPALALGVLLIILGLELWAPLVLVGIIIILLTWGFLAP